MISRQVAVSVVLALAFLGCSYWLISQESPGPVAPLGHAVEVDDRAQSQPRGAELVEPSEDQGSVERSKVVIEEEEGDQDFEAAVSEDLGFAGRSRSVPPKRTIRVEVYSAEGEPAEATLELLAIDTRRGSLKGVKKDVSREGRGSYTLAFSPADEPLWITAEAGERGVGSVPWEEALRCVDEDRPVRIAVRGAGRITGQVVDGSGLPVAWLRMVAVLSDLTPAPHHSGAGYSSRVEQLIDGMGRGKAYFYSDANGEFSVGGLREGTYRIIGGMKWGEGGLEYRDPMAQVEAAANPVPIILRLRESRLFIHVTTPTLAGAPAEDEPDGRKEWLAVQVELYDLGRTDEERPEGLLANSLETRRSPIVYGQFKRQLVDGHYVFQAVVEQGHRYAVRAQQDERLSLIETVEIEDSGLQAFVELSLPRKPRTAELRVFVRFEPVVDEYPDVGNAAKIYLSDAETGLPIKVSWRGESGSESGTFTTAPIGRIMVVAEGAYYRQYPVGDMTKRRRHGRAAKVVEITEGIDRQVEIHLPLGGAVRVAASTVRPLPEQLRGRRIRIKLRGAGQLEDVDLEHLYRTKRGGALASNHWSFGEPVTSECVPEGRYFVTATLGTLAPIEREIEIKSGEVTDLALVFE